MKLKALGNNQNAVTLADGTEVFFSYNTPVAATVGGKAFRTVEKWSQSTSRHINKYLGGREAEEKPQNYFDTLAG